VFAGHRAGRGDERGGQAGASRRWESTGGLGGGSVLWSAGGWGAVVELAVAGG
jgi:hypothetical protein